jgi:hypothetical protein
VAEEVKKSGNGKCNEVRFGTDIKKPECKPQDKTHEIFAAIKTISERIDAIDKRITLISTSHMNAVEDAKEQLYIIKEYMKPWYKR